MLSFEEKGSDPRVNIKDHTNFNEKKSLKFTKLYFSFTSKQCYIMTPNYIFHEWSSCYYCNLKISPQVLFSHLAIQCY